MRNETVRELKPTDEKTSECHGEDIDKLNLVARHNTIFTTDVAAASSAVGHVMNAVEEAGGAQGAKRQKS